MYQIIHEILYFIHMKFDKRIKNKIANTRQIRYWSVIVVEGR